MALRFPVPAWFSGRVFAAAIVAGMVASACNVHDIAAPGRIASIVVTPNATLAAGTSQQMAAVGYDADGRVVPLTPTWSVAAGGGTIGGTGLFTAGFVTGVFTNTVVASWGAVTGRATITVTPGAVATLTLTPTPVTLAVSTAQQFVAEGKDAGGNVVPITPTWAVAAGGGTIDQSGRFVAGQTVGTFTRTVVVAANGLTAFATVNVTAGPLVSIAVTPNPATLPIRGVQQFVAVGKDVNGNTVPIAAVWSAVAGGGTIDSLGRFTAGTTLGTFASTVKATSGSLSGTATVIVTAGALAQLTVTPNPATVPTRGAQQFVAAGTDASGNIVPVTAAWTVVAGGGAIDGAGLFTAGSIAGTFTNTVTATSGTLSATATVIVTAGALASITVSPTPSTLAMQGTQRFTAVGKDALGNIVPITPTWSVVSGGGAIDQTAMFTAGATAGTFANTVKATSGALSGTATVIVTNGALASLTVLPNPDTLAAGGKQQFVAIGKDASGNVVPVAAAWSVVAGGGAVDAGGLFTAGTVAGAFVNTVRATTGALSATATVVVTAGPLATITVTPNPVTLAVGASQPFAAVGRDANGNVVPVSPSWSVVAGGGTVDVGGVFIAGVVPGTFAGTVKATSGAISGTATVVVTAGPLASIAVTPNPATMPVNGTQAFVAVGTDVNGNVQPIAATWSVVAGGGAIGGSGVFTAGAVAGTFANTVKATSGTLSGTATVIVTAGALASLTISPNPVTLAIGGVQQFVAVGKDASGNVVPVVATWSVVAGGGTTDASGRFTAGAVSGTFANTVKATSGALSATATVVVTAGALSSITVTPNPGTMAIGGAQQFTAVGKDADGNVVPFVPVWSVVAGGGTIDPTGLFTAGTLSGTFANTVKAASGALSGTATVIVTTGALASLTVTPNPATVVINGTQSFTAVGKDASGNVVAVTPVWSVVAGGGAIEAAGLFTAGAVAGVFTNTVRAAVGSVSGNATVIVTSGALATITVTPNPATMTINGVQQFTATGADAAGNAIAITPVWSVVAGGGAIAGGGLFTAGTVAGTFANTVRATSGGVSGFATVNVTAGALTTITVAPNPATLAIGGTQQFTATGTDANGNVRVIAATWSVTSGGGTIDATGVFTAGTLSGTFTNTVRATVGALSGSATVIVTAGTLASITVTPNPATLAALGTQQFVATGRDLNGNTVPVTAFWSVVAGGGSIDAAGVFTAGTVSGTYANTVRATSGALSGTATVIVTAGALASITVSPNPATLTAGGTQLFTAVGRDANGNVVPIAPSWTVVALGGAIDGAGLFTAGATAGTFTNTVKAASGAVSGVATVIVNAGALATITVSPNPATLAINGAQQFTAVGRDAGGNVVAITPTWSVTAAGGTIDAAGRFTAGTVAGTFVNTVKATSGALSANATVIVTAGALASIAVTPNPATLAIGGTQQFTAVGSDANGNVVPLTPLWSVVAGGGVVDGAGLFTAGTLSGTFTNTVKATSGAISGTATVIVNTGALASITVTPSPATVAIGGVQPFTAVGRDANGNVVAIVATWSVVAGGGVIDGTGRFTAGTTAGTFTSTVRAVSGAVSGSATVIVTAGALASITVTPNPASVAIGATQQFTAVGRDANGNVVAIAPTWSVVAAGGAVDGSGLFTAGAVAGTFANTVQATSGALAGRATVVVTAGALASITVTPSTATLAVHGVQAFVAVGRDASGNIVPLTPVWSVLAGGGSIDASGVFTAGTTAGTFANTVRAASGALADSSTVVVTSGALATMTVTPNPATLAIGGAQQFTVTGADANGNAVAVAPVWSVVAGGGSIGASGLFAAGTLAGTFTNTVRATSGAVTASATVIVTAGVLASITVTPDPATLAANGVQQLVAIGYDINGNVVPVAPVWSVVAGGGGVNATGRFTAGTVAGTFTNTARATVGAVSGNATVIVTAGALASITLTPNPATLPLGGVQQFAATGKDANGNTVPLAATWSVVAGGGTIDAAGLFTAGTVAGTYTNTVKVTSGAITATATVVVTAGTLANLSVIPNPATMAVNGTQLFAATGTDASGNAVAVTPVWSVVAGGGSIAASGLFTAGTASGTFTNTVKATSGAISATATVIVTAGALASVTVTPNPANLAINAAQAFSAVGKDANGNVVPIVPVWSVVAGGGAIDGAGLFTAGTASGTFTNTVKATVGALSGTATVNVASGVLASITVTPTPAALAIGGTQQFTAVGRDVNGNVVPITPAWTIVAGGGTTNATGLFTAGTAAGTFANTVKATSGAISATATVVISAGALSSLTVTPDPATMAVGGTQQFTATGTDVNGNVVPVTPSWSVAAGGGAVNASGLFTAGTVAGTFTNTVTATSGALTGAATVIVTSGALASVTVTPNPAALAIGASQQFTATGRDANGNTVAIAPVWSVVASGGTITAGGNFTAGTVSGTFANTVRATAGALSGFATVVVTSGALATITVTPNPATLAIGATQQFTAVARDVNGNVIAIAPSWSVVAGGGSIDAAGVFTAGTISGAFANTVRATSGAVSGAATVNVTAGALASLTVTPNPAALAAGGTQQFTAVGRDANGNVVPATPSWSVVAGGGSVDAAGLFTAGLASGTFTNTVRAAIGAVSGSATVVVSSGALATITVTPNPVTLAIGGTQQFTAVGRDVNGNVVPIAATWSVVAGGGAVDAGGLFTAGTTSGTFTNTVRAAVGAVSGGATVIVSAGVLSSITVAPNPATVAIGGAQQFTAVGKDVNGNVVAFAPVWSVVAAGGTIDAAGLFTAGTTAGTFANTVRAASGAVAGTATVVVSTGALATITVTPSPATLAIGGTQQFTAVGKDVNGNVVPIVPVWQVVASGGSIGGAGLFTAGTVAGTFTNTVQATSGAVSGTATVIVNPGALATITVTPNPTTLAIGGTRQFTAAGKDVNGNAVAMVPVWSVVAGGGTIGGGGLFTAGAVAGTFTNTVQASSGAVSGTATVVVSTGTLATITIAPNPATMTINGTQSFTAAGTDASGNPVALAVTWSVVAGGGTIDAAGVFTAGTAAGTFTNTVRATSGAISDFATVNVTAGALASITVTPNPQTLAIGGAQQFAATGTDASGNVQAIAATWSVVAGGGSINASGLFTAGTVSGTFTNTVRASVGALSGSATVIVTAGALATITVSPNPATLAVNGVQQFTATGTDANGNSVPVVATWSAVAGGGAINASGLFTAGTVPGTYTNTVRATVGSVSGNATVVVTAGPLATITVTPNPATLAINGTQQFVATGADASGNAVPVAASWSVVALGGAIDGAGLFTAGTTAGTFTNTVRATSGAISGTATVIVTAGVLASITVTPNPATLAIGGTQQFTATGRDIAGNAVAIAPSWSVVAGGGTISGGGLFTAGTVSGTFTNTVKATSGAITATATVVVSSGALATITVTPDPVTLAVGGTQQFAAVGKDANGNVVAISATWSVAAGGGSIGAAGLFTAGTTAGTFTNTVRATSGAVSGSATVVVTAGPLATITVTPNPAALTPNATQQLVAIGYDINGNVVPVAPVWSVVAGGGAVSAGGLFTAGTVPGTYTNTARAASGAVAGTATVVVSAGALASITVTPNPATLAINGTQQFTAVGHDASGNVVPLVPTWSVVALGGAVDGNGLFTAGTTPGTFTGTVQAASGAITGVATVVVTAGPLATITVTPNPASLAVGGAQQFTAVGRDASGNLVTIAPAWSVVAGGGTISAAGLFSAGTVSGTFTNTVRAASGAVAGTATVVVTAGALATITVTPNPAALAINGTQQFTAVGTDASGNVVPLSATWSVVASGGAIDAAGLFTAGTVSGAYTNTVRATSGAVSGFATVNVTAGALASITVTPNPATLITQTTQLFAAVGRDASGNIVPIAPSWSVVAGGGSVDAGGAFTAGTAAGTFTNTVRATVGAVSGNATVVVTAGALASITVTPNPATLVAGGTQQFTAAGADANGNAVVVVPAWSVVAGGGTINGSGVFTAGAAAGTYANTVRATSGAINGAATVMVTAGALASITVTPSPANLAIGGTQQFTAVGADANGNVVAITPAWTVVAGGGGIGASGLFTAGSVAGTFTNTVRATSGAVSGSATVVVGAGALATITVTPSPATLAIGGTQQFTAVGADANGNTVVIAPVWSVVASGGSSSAGGLFTAGTVSGTFTNTVRASSGAVSGFATVVVTAGALANITVTPNPATLTTGAAQQFAAVGTDANGNVVPVTPSWSVVAGGGSVNVSGLFTAGATSGTFTNSVRATSGAVAGSATVIVTPGALASIVVTPNPATLAIGGTQQFTAVGLDADGNTVAIAPAWSVVASGGSISGGGLFTAGTVAGTFTGTVRATSGAISGAATVVVNAGALATMTVTPNPASLAIGGTQQFTAVGRDANGNAIAIAPVWTVAAGGGVVDGAGVFTAGTVAGTFANTVRATSGAVSGTATVVVTVGPLATITITPNPATVAVGATQQFAAAGADAGGNAVAITPSWAVVAGGGTIGGTGLFTAGFIPGTFTNTVRATSGAVTAFATVVIPQPPSPLASAAAFAVLAGSAITCSGSGAISGATGPANIGSSPTPSITGFFPSCTYTGSIPLPAVVGAAKTDLSNAFATANAQSCDADLTGTDLGYYDGTTVARTLAPGTYCFSTTAGLTGAMTLDGNAGSKWTFRIGSTLTTTVGSSVTVTGGAIADNVYWIVGSSATLNTSTAMQGNILAFTSISLLNGVTLSGRALALNGAVDMTAGAVTITKP